MIQHPKIEANNVIHDGEKKTPIVGFFSFFLAGKKVVSPQSTLNGNSANRIA